jgi:hypothetical protein
MSTSAKVERLCSKPGCQNAGVHLCSGCGEESYCSKECQREHWQDHKIACKLAVKPETAAILQSFDGLSIKQLKNLVSAKAATMEPKKRAIVLGQLENVVEKNNLLWLVKQHVQPSEIEVLLTNNPPSVQPTHVEVPAGGAKGGTGVKRKLQSKKSDPSPFNGQTPTPQQLKEQASMMRKNPDLVRRSNPAFLKMSNAQIIAYADHIEKAASDPAMMKEIEKMSKLSSTERDQIQSLQEGLSGAREMDDNWINSAIKTLKSNPELIKSMFRGRGDMLGGVSDSQIDSFIDGASKMDASLLKWIIRSLKFLGTLAKPATEVYNKVNQYTFGQANTILSMLVLVFISLLGYTIYRVLGFAFGLIWSFYSGKAATSTAVPAVSKVVSDIVEVSTTAAATSSVVDSIQSEISKQDVKSAARPNAKAESVDAEFEF